MRIRAPLMIAAALAMIMSTLTTSTVASAVPTLEENNGGVAVASVMRYQVIEVISPS